MVKGIPAIRDRVVQTAAKLILEPIFEADLEPNAYFLGYTFGPHFSRRTGREYAGYSPSKKSVNRIKEKVGEHLVKARQCGSVGRRARRAESETERLESVFRTGESNEGV